MSFFARIFGLEDAEDIRAKVEDLRIEMRRLQEEWTDVYNKFRVMQMRVAKQVQRLDANSSTEEPQRAGSDGNGPPSFSSLSPRAQELQKQILERRARGWLDPQHGYKEGGE